MLYVKFCDSKQKDWYLDKGHNKHYWAKQEKQSYKTITCYQKRYSKLINCKQNQINY